MVEKSYYRRKKRVYSAFLRKILSFDVSVPDINVDDDVVVVSANSFSLKEPS